VQPSSTSGVVDLKKNLNSTMTDFILARTFLLYFDEKELAKKEIFIGPVVANLYTRLWKQTSYRFREHDIPSIWG
jgi:hypothetical protein